LNYQIAVVKEKQKLRPGTVMACQFCQTQLAVLLKTMSPGQKIRAEDWAPRHSKMLITEYAPVVCPNCLKQQSTVYGQIFTTEGWQ